MEQNGDFVSFKSNDEAYFTVDGEKNLGFTKSSAPEENQKFLLDEQCSSSKIFNTYLAFKFITSALCLCGPFGRTFEGVLKGNDQKK